MQTTPAQPGTVTITPSSSPGARTASDIARAVSRRLDPTELITVTEVVTITTTGEPGGRTAAQLAHAISGLLDAEETATT